MARQLQPCGTQAAYQRHKRRNEEPCAACEEAARNDRRARYLAEIERAGDRDPCIECGGERGPGSAHGWCCACYHRWLRAARPEDGPPPRPSARREEYAWLREQGTPIEEAAARAGIAVSTAVIKWEPRRLAGTLTEVTA